MAISQRAAGTWAASNATTQTVTIPGGVQAGDLMVCVAAVKPYTAAPTIDQGWSTLYTGTGGSTANGNGTGSQLHAIFYKIHTGTESNPTITWGTTSAPGGAVIIALQKGSSENFGLRVVGLATEQAATSTPSINTGIGITDVEKAWVQAGSLIFGLISAGDDSATFTRSTTAISFTSGGGTLADHVEYPGTHLSTTTSNDIAIDLGYREVTSEVYVGNGASRTISATISASERCTGTIFVVDLIPHIIPSAIDSAESFGSPTLTQGTGGPGTQVVSPGSISSSEIIGSHTLVPGSATVVLASINSAESVSTPAVKATSNVVPTAITSAETFGAQTIAKGNVTIYPSAISSAEVFPSPTIGKGNVNIVPTAISSAESVGAPVLKPTNTIAPTAIGSAETVGSHSLLPGNVNIVPTAVASAESLGTPTLRATSNIVASAIDGGPLFDPYIYDPGVFDTHAGRPTVLSNAYIVPTAIPSAESFGTPSLLPGTATIAPVAIDSSEVVNSPTLKPTNTIAPSAITTDAIIENFNGYADGDPITDLTGWQIVYGSDIVLRAAGHVRAAHDPTGDLINYHAAAYDRSIPGTAYSQVQVITESGYYAGPAVRVNAANGNNYFANLYNTGVLDVVELRSFNGGNPQSAGVSVTATGRYVRIEAYGVSPTRLKIYTSPDGVVWSLLINTTNSNAALQNLSGRVGFLLTSDFSGAGNGNELDNFQGGGLDLAPPSLGRTIHVSSIASAESVGTPVLPTAGAPASILPSAVDSAEVVPNPTIIPGGVVIAPTGITSGEALGALVLRATATILPSAIASAEQVGTPTVLAGGVLISPSAIGSGETFGTPTVVRGNVTVAPNSISSAEAVGSPVLAASAVVLPGAIGSGEVFGTPAVTPGSVAILPGSIASGESIGSHTVVSGPGTLTIYPVSINSAEAVGTPTLLPGGVSIQPSAIASGEAFGSQTVLPGTWPISPTSIGTGEVLGTPTILPGQVQIIPSGVTTAEILGSPVLTIEDLSQFIVPETIASLEAFGFVTLIPGTAYITPESIASLEDVQELVLTGSRVGWHWNSSNGFGYGRRGGWPGTQSGFGTGNSEPGPSLQSGFARARRNKGEGG